MLRVAELIVFDELVAIPIKISKSVRNNEGTHHTRAGVTFVRDDIVVGVVAFE